MLQKSSKGERGAEINRILEIYEMPIGKSLDMVRSMASDSSESRIFMRD